MEALIAALLSAAALAGGASASSASRAAIAEFYAPPNGGSLTIDAERHTVEACWDLCEFYQLTKLSEQGWDVIFLHQYAITGEDNRTAFRDRYESVAQDLTEKYSGICPKATPQTRASCILDRLGKTHKVRVALVRYDEGYRCQVESRLTDSKFQGRSKCTKVRHAS